MTSRDDQRRSRLAQALRANLKRRKAADGPPAPARAAPSPDVSASDERD